MTLPSKALHQTTDRMIMTTAKRSALGAPIKKLVLFTDIHWGARNNSDQHLDDCLKYVDWLIEVVKAEKPSHIAFLGDWYENRNAINVRTLNAAQEGARRINELGIPVIFIVGNHDLYHRANRKVFSTNPFKDLHNFHVISEPVSLNKDWYVAPYLFRSEYAEQLIDINSHRYVMGHFEFRNFIVTGADRRLDHGPDAADFARPKYIFTGHFHKRQVGGNIVYIGNTFPTNFGDAGDAERGCAVFDVGADDISFIDWPDAPLFFKTRLTRVLNGEGSFPANSRVRCVLDMDVGYSDVQALRDEMMEMYKLREFSVEEDLQSKKEALMNGLELLEEVDLASLDNTVRKLIHEGVTPTPTIDPALLVSLYEELKTET
jgi:DNA repair exonuclease SbcCD nuclease subunit